MKYSLKFLFVLTLLVGLLLLAFKIAPTIVTSMLLLIPMPMLIVILVFKAFHRYQLPTGLLLLMPFAIYAFYIGMLGPFAGFVSAPDSWGMEESQTKVMKVMDRYYTPEKLCAPILFFDEKGESKLAYAVGNFLVEYQHSWMSLFDENQIR